MKEILGLVILVLIVSGCTGDTPAEQIQPVCNHPYILVGTGCCLDQNDNAICDSDESDISKEAETKAESEEEPKTKTIPEIEPEPESQEITEPEKECPQSCDAGNPCTTDTCSAETGYACKSEPKCESDKMCIEGECFGKGEYVKTIEVRFFNPKNVGKLGEMEAMVIDSMGRIYILDNLNYVNIYSATGGSLDRVLISESEYPEFDSYDAPDPLDLRDIAVDSNDYIYLAANTEFHKFQYKDNKLIRVASVGAGTSYSITGSNYQLGQLTNIAIASGGKIWLVDGTNEELIIYYPNYEKVSGLGRDLHISDIRLVATDQYGGYILTSNSLRTYDLGGIFQGAFPVFGDLSAHGYQLNDPQKMEADNNRFMYVADHADNVIKVLDLIEKRIVSGLGSTSKTYSNYTFSEPSDIAFDSNGLVYIADSGHNRIQVFVPPVTR